MLTRFYRVSMFYRRRQDQFGLRSQRAIPIFIFNVVTETEKYTGDAITYTDFHFL